MPVAVAPTVYIDYDATLNNLIDAWVSWINQTYLTNYALCDVTHWDWFGDIQRELEIDVFAWFNKNITYSSKGVLPLSGARSFYEEINKYFNTHILTSTHDEAIIEMKEQHIGKYFQTDKIIHHHEKWDYATSAFSMNILIDDRVMNCVKWVEHGGRAFLYNHNNSYPYSKTSYEHPMLHKVSCYGDIVHILKDLYLLERDTK